MCASHAYPPFLLLSFNLFFLLSFVNLFYQYYVNTLFGDGWYCRPEDPKATLGECTGYAANCNIADILNSDGTCISDKVSGKSPLGVVAYIGDDNCGQALSLKDLGSKQWSAVYGSIPSSPSVGDCTVNENDFGSCAHTQELIESEDESVYPAVWTAYNYVPTAAPKTKGKWCLPTIGVGLSIMDNYDVINSGLLKAEGEELPLSSGHTFWSSSIGPGGCVRVWNYKNSIDATYNLKSRYYVRPVIEF